MSKFELSDKELKQLLQNEGLEEPSMSFNRMILEKTQAFEQTRSIKTPLALKIAFGVLMLIPLILIFVGGGVDLGLAETIKEQQISIPSSSLDFQVNSYYFYFLALTVGVIWLSVFFNKVLSNQK